MQSDIGADDLKEAVAGLAGGKQVLFELVKLIRPEVAQQVPVHPFPVGIFRWVGVL